MTDDTLPHLKVEDSGRIGTAGEWRAWVVPSSEDPGYSFVSVQWNHPGENGGAIVDGIRLPVRDDFVDRVLTYFHFPLNSATWDSLPVRWSRNELLAMGCKHEERDGEGNTTSAFLPVDAGRMAGRCSLCGSLVSDQGRWLHDG